jgi:sulfate adenylyltransferase
LNEAVSVKLISPYAGTLVDLFVRPAELEEATACGNTLPSLQLSSCSLCNLEMLAVAPFSPLDRFMHAEDHQRVLDALRLKDGSVFPVPIGRRQLLREVNE